MTELDILTAGPNSARAWLRIRREMSEELVRMLRGGAVDPAIAAECILRHNRELGEAIERDAGGGECAITK